MIAKKSKHADLERKRFAFFQIGLIVAGSLTLVAFEYSTAEVKPKHVEIQNPFDNGLMVETLYEQEDAPKPESKEEDQRANIQMTPIDDVTITTNPVKTLFTNVQGNYIVVNDPCTDCYDNPEIEPEDDVVVPDIDPSFPGGFVAMKTFIVDHVNYPEMAHDAGIEGTAYVQFVVNTDGSIVNVKTQNKVDASLAKEAERVVKMMPNWIPGEIKGKKVRSQFIVPIAFTIQK